MDTESNLRAVETTRTEPKRIDLDDYASYEDGDSLVVCDRENANAWIKSDSTVEIRD
jgi:hypothetical protein